MTSIIELQDVSKVYPGRWFRGVPTLRDVLLHPRTKRRPVVAPNIAVDGVSLSIHAGERVGVIGPNGAGKTTLLKLVAGLSAPTSGEVTVRGRVTAILTLGVGLRDELTGRENVYIEGELQGRNREDVDRVIDTVVEFADLGEFIDLPVLTYSTGMKARLAFAAAVHVDPEILLIDEALSVGDAAFAIKARRKVRELCTRGKVAVIVSHSMENIVDLCTRCLWIEGGRLRQDGDPVTVTQMYVEAVHRRDDAALLERFRRLV
jgi:lipopolysaccharide transport system ATP-binding protein